MAPWASSLLPAQSFIGWRGPKFTPVALAACALALASCGGDDEDQPATTPDTTQATVEQPPPEATETEAPPATETEAPESETEAEPPVDTSPEDQPGGVGDEEPVHSLARFTGRGGAILPRLVRVPAFIAIRVEIRSADGEPYGLRCGDESIEAGGQLGSVSTMIDGLRPGDSITCTPTAAGNRVRISATAEPGP